MRSPPLAPTLLPLGGGGSCDALLWRSLKTFCFWKNWYYRTIATGAPQWRGEAPRASGIEMIPMKIALNKCDFRIYYSLNYFRWVPPTPKGRPSGGSITGSILKTWNCPAVPRERPWGGEPSYLRFSRFRCELTKFMPVSTKQKSKNFWNPCSIRTMISHKETLHQSHRGRVYRSGFNPVVFPEWIINCLSRTVQGNNIHMPGFHRVWVREGHCPHDPHRHRKHRIPMTVSRLHPFHSVHILVFLPSFLYLW
jgi:hypothetical protein